MPELEISDGLLNSLGTSAETIFDDSIQLKKKKKKKFLKIFLINITLKVLKILWMKKVKFQKAYIFLWWGR